MTYTIKNLEEQASLLSLGALVASLEGMKNHLLRAAFLQNGLCFLAIPEYIKKWTNLTT